jgi:MYXO-CTERM domain-containing protein
MKMSTSRFAGLLLFGALLVGTPLLSGKDKDKCKDWNGDKDDRGCAQSVAVPDSHGAPLLVLTAGVLGAAILVRRRKATS